MFAAADLMIVLHRIYAISRYKVVVWISFGAIKSWLSDSSHKPVPQNKENGSVMDFLRSVCE